MLAVFVNCFTVIVGGLIGVLFSSRIKESLSVTVQNAARFHIDLQIESDPVLYHSIFCGSDEVIGTNAPMPPVMLV